jgi:hypothetical protein
VVPVGLEDEVFNIPTHWNVVGSTAPVDW